MAENTSVVEKEETPNRTCEEQQNEKVVHTRDGSVDWYGNPSVRSKSGGWIAAVLLLVNQGLITLAFFGVAANLVLFMTRVMHMENADAANHVSNWVGTAYMFSMVGAFISDSHWGRYKTCFIFQLVFFTGLVELSLSSYFILQKSCYSNETEHCKAPSNFELLIFYMSVYQIALGNGGYQPPMTAFGADQFDAEYPEEQKFKMVFFSYFFVANNIGSLFSDIVLTYLQDKGHWVLSFGFSAAASFLGIILFFSGTPRFRYFKPGGNPLIRISQVIVASVKNRKVKAPQAEHLYEDDGKTAGRKILYTPEFKCLDKAAVVLHSMLSPKSTQKVSSRQSAPCTVTQVEEVKCILRLFPIWLCTVVYSISYNQMSSVFIEQGEAMNSTVAKLQIPPGSMNVFEIFGVSSFIILYQSCISPLMPKILKKDLTELQRMGIGFIIAIMAMFSAGLVEVYRLKHAIRVCTSRCEDSSNLSILWQMPQYVLVGASEVFTYVGMMEFFNKESPDGLKSFASALYVASMSAGSYLSELIVTVIIKVSGKGSRDGWISENLNKGHMDNFYFLVGLLNVLGFILFVVCSKRFRCIQFAEHNQATGILMTNGGEDALITTGDAQLIQIEEIEVLS